MIIIAECSLIPDENDSSKYFVKSKEKGICPICLGEALKVIGSKNRRAINSKSEDLIIVIRRLKCACCKKIHHELPDILVPYKRYLSSCVEAIVDDKADEISCENSSIYRLRLWFKSMVTHIRGSISSVIVRMNIKQKLKEQSDLEMIKTYVGEKPGWLARVVRIVVNTNNWLHTRFAFMTG